jgi:hypothetical protein
MSHGSRQCILCTVRGFLLVDNPYACIQCYGCKAVAEAARRLCYLPLSVVCSPPVHLLFIEDATVSMLAVLWCGMPLGRLLPKPVTCE